jgi:hypothetical protein
VAVVRVACSMSGLPIVTPTFQRVQKFGAKNLLPSASQDKSRVLRSDRASLSDGGCFPGSVCLETACEDIANLHPVIRC